MKNHLVIGLGGTGGRVIRALRKRIYQEHRNHQIPGLGLEYLYIDSSGELMNQNDPTWKTLGTSVQLPPANQLRIAGANLRQIITEIRSYQGIAKWIGNRELWEKVPADIVTSGAGGQRRRLGRFLFAMKVAEFNEKLKVLSQAAKDRTATTGMHYHIVTGLAGGTGSGALIDVIAQIKTFSTNTQDDLVVYAILPDSNPSPGWDAGNYHANGYAALIELNGLMIGRYRPWDTLKGNENILIGDILKGVYLATNENENNISLKMETELPEVVADFLYEVVAESMNAKPPTQSLENFAGGPECVLGTEEPLRARKFSSFGIKRVAVPEEEIAEYLTTSFARQAILQLYYNNWDDRVGYRDEPPPRNYTAIVSDKDTQNRWLMSDQHLMLELPILPEDIETAKAKNWQPDIASEWMSFSSWLQPQCADLSREDKLNELQKGFEDEFARGFRGRGVNDFYKVGAAGRQKMAHYLVSGIEREFFQKWREGTYSAREIEELLTALRNHLDDRKKNLESRRASINKDMQAYNDDLAEVRDIWANLGLICYPLKWKGLFDHYANSCRDLHRSMTEAEAFDFAISLIPQILDAIVELKDSVNQVTSRFEAALDEFKKKIDARVKEKEARNFRDTIVKYYDPAIVKKVVERLVTSRDEQFQQTAVVRKALIDEKRLGGTLTFEKFRERVVAIDLLDVLERTCLEQARNIHDKLVQSERERILGVRLMTRLRDEYGSSEEKLREFARQVIQPAKTFVRFDQTEVKRGLVGAPTVGGGAQQAILIKRPCPEDLKDFVSRLDQALKQVDTNVRDPVDNENRPHELSVLSFIGNFPLRYLEILRLLRNKYRSLVDGNSGPLAKLELHTDDLAFELPDLYVEGGPPKNSLAYLMLAEQLEILKEEEDPVSGLKVAIARIGKGARQRTLRLGESIEKAIESLDHANFLLLKPEVDQRLTADFQHINDKRDLLEKLENKLEKIRFSLKGGDLRVFRQPLSRAV
jgi:hypothetical protein